MEATSDLSRSVITAGLHCRRCGYDLRGLSPLGQCPECGSDIWLTIQSTVDPAASRLPQLRSPAGVGDGLVAIMACWMLSWLIAIARPLALWVDELHLAGRMTTSAWTPRSLPLYAGLVGLLALWGVWRIAPPPGKEPPGPVWRDVYLLGLGLATWSVLLMLGGWAALARAGDTVRLVLQLAMSLAAIVGLSGLSGVLAVIGLRSREYRTSRGGRQSAQAMIAAIVWGALGELLVLASHLAELPGTMETMGYIALATSQMMIFIGAIYLVANAWWIRTALRRPPPSLSQVLTIPAPHENADSQSGLRMT